MVTINSVLPADTDKVAQIITEAFANDPTWTWAFPDTASQKIFWRFFVNSTFRHPHVIATEGFEAVALWVPPYGDELSEEDEQKLPALLDELAANRASKILKLMEMFDQHRPKDKPHYYLSLLATQNQRRGKGLGISLLKACLDKIDLEHLPAYLESTNSQNNKRYESVGFEEISRFQAPDNGPTVTCMWRKACT